IASAIFGYVNLQRAREAQAKAQETRALAERARSEAEKLIVYLLDDFYLELEPVGRLDIVANLSKRAVDYYAALPPELRNPESERTRALALVRYGYTLRYLNRLDEAQKSLDEAIAVLRKLRAGGDNSDAAIIGLALGLSARGRVYDSQSDMTDAASFAEESTKVLEPLMAQPNPSVAVRRAFGQVANYMGFTRIRVSQEAEAVKWLDRSREAFRSIDGLQLGDLAAAAGFAEATSWKVDALNELGRSKEIVAAAEEGRKVASAVLEKRPGHMGALRSRALLSSSVSSFKMRDLRPHEAIAFADSATSDWDALLKLDPGNAIAWSNISGVEGNKVWALWDLGRSREALDLLQAILHRIPAQEPLRSYVMGNFNFGAGWGAVWAADFGSMQESADLLNLHRRYAELSYQKSPKAGFYRAWWPEWTSRFEYLIAEARSDYPRMQQLAEASIKRLKQIPVTIEGQRRAVQPMLAQAYDGAAMARFYQRDYAGAEAAAREAVKVQAGLPVQNADDEQSVAYHQIILAMALAKQERLPEARQALEPALELHRKLMKRGTEDLGEHLTWATALYAAALANPAQAPGLLDEAQRVVMAVPAEMARRHSVAVVRNWIAEERAKRPG
ncbi:MAG TPA: tetratricopeptide repeat protein, partial [Usitatibacter sp.]|nr:tetratricopeptide repeat protein [Usitatibacter sp.]